MSQTLPDKETSMRPLKKRPKPARGKAYGILNPWGDVWTHETFETEAKALAHLVAFWREFSDPQDLSRFRIVPVKVTVSVLQNAQPDEAARERSEHSTAVTQLREDY